MDRSPEYIEMCLSAHEIQTKYNDGFSNGDIAFDLSVDISDTNPYIITAYNPSLIDSDSKIFVTITEHVWLPRQDQLQELMKSRNRGLTYSPKLYINILNNNSFMFYEENKCQPSSMEQLHLITLMRENYNKKWNLTTKTWETC